MQFNLYVTVKNPEGLAEFELEKLVRHAAGYAAAAMTVLPDVDETVQLHEDAEILVTLNRSE